MRGNMLHLVGRDSARTQVSAAEHDLLRHFAAGSRSVVELGVFEGATTAVLRGVMSPEGSLTGVDPFFGGRLGIRYGEWIARREARRVPRGRVRFWRMTSHEASRRWTSPIDFLFVDADHAYESVRQDWDDWSLFVAPGGHVGLHDSRVHPGGTANEGTGPVRLAAEIERGDPRFRRVGEVDSLTVWGRMP